MNRSSNPLKYQILKFIVDIMFLGKPENKLWERWELVLSFKGNPQNHNEYTENPKMSERVENSSMERIIFRERSPLFRTCLMGLTF